MEQRASERGVDREAKPSEPAKRRHDVVSRRRRRRAWCVVMQRQPNRRSRRRDHGPHARPLLHSMMLLLSLLQGPDSIEDNSV